jgi:mannose/fructose/N-acetylgalactosamine-specific phosphotransferase system component IIC
LGVISTRGSAEPPLLFVRLVLGVLKWGLARGGDLDLGWVGRVQPGLAGGGGSPSVVVD